MAAANPFRFSTQYQDEGTDLICYLHRCYNSSTGRWFSRDLIEEEGGLNLYAFVGGNPVDDFDEFGLCTSCTCKSVKVTFSPGGNKFKPGFYDTKLGPRFGGYIIVAWTVDGDPNSCQYFVNEPAGGATFTFPDKTKSTTLGTLGWIPVPQVWYDATGVWVSTSGKYKAKYKLTQSYECIGSDGSRITTPPTTFKASTSNTWPWKER